MTLGILKEKTIKSTVKVFKECSLATEQGMTKQIVF
jgi:hypothetical protein